MAHLNEIQDNSNNQNSWYFSYPSPKADASYYSELIKRIGAQRDKGKELFSNYREFMKRTRLCYDGLPTNRPTKADPKKQKDDNENNLTILEKHNLVSQTKEVKEAILKSESPKRTLQKIDETQDSMNKMAQLSDEGKIKIANGECNDPAELLIQNLAKAKPELDIEYKILAEKICGNNKEKRIALDMLYKEIPDLKELEEFINSLQARMTNEKLADIMLEKIAKGDKDKQESIKKTPLIEAVTTFIPQNIGKPHNPPALRAQINKRLGRITTQSRNRKKRSHETS